MAAIPRELRLLVYTRDQATCQACGRNLENETWYSIQHRKARGVGGQNRIENLILVCGSATSRGCHRRCEDRDPEMTERGFVVPSWDDETLVPVTTWDGTRVLLTSDGTATPSYWLQLLLPQPCGIGPLLRGLQSTHLHVHSFGPRWLLSPFPMIAWVASFGGVQPL